MCWLCEDLSSGSASGARQPSQMMLSRSEGGNACYLVLRRVSEQDSAHHRRSPALFLCFNQMAGEVCHVVRNEKRELCVCGARRFSSSSRCVVSVIKFCNKLVRVSVPTNSRVLFSGGRLAEAPCSLLPGPCEGAIFSTTSLHQWFINRSK